MRSYIKSQIDYFVDKHELIEIIKEIAFALYTILAEFYNTH